MADLVDAIHALSPHIRYVAVYVNGTLTSSEKAGLQSASSSESDKYEELIVNPTLLKLVGQRGDIDCGGMRYVLIRYGNFFEYVAPVEGGHVSVGIAPEANPLPIIERIEALIQSRHPRR